MREHRTSNRRLPKILFGISPPGYRGFVMTRRMPLLSRPRGCRIDDEFMPARARHREIGGPFALEDAVDIDAGLAPLVRWAHAVLINPPATALG